MGKLRVLIVDDSKISRVMLAENLRETDFEICGMAGDAAEALKLYTEMQPDLVTMDMNLPDTNGLECSRRILIQNADARILMISAMKDLKLITQGKAVGVRAFLQKPVSKHDLVDTLHLIAHTERKAGRLLSVNFMQSHLHGHFSRERPAFLRWRAKRKSHLMCRVRLM